MKPQGLRTKIFLDSGGADETSAALDVLGFLDGQTTNPTYFAKSASVQERLARGERFTPLELLAAYRKTVESIRKIVPEGSVSIEVYADEHTSPDTMVAQAREMFEWIPGAHIKFPITSQGMRAAYKALESGIRVNMTLCFTQAQAAAVASMARGAKRGDVFVSPFIGRHTDAGRNGIEFIRNIIRMYREQDIGNIMVLSASLRSLEQFYAAIAVGTDIITAGLKYLQAWSEDGIKVPSKDFKYEPGSADSPIPYEDHDLSKPWDLFDIKSEMTDKGLRQFVDDWNNLLVK